MEFLLAAVAAVLKKSRELELLLARLRRVGRSSERIDPKQLALLFGELIDQLGSDPGAPDPEVEGRADAELEAEIEREQALRHPQDRPQRQARGGWRTDGVKREVHRLEVPLEERTCIRCGCEQHKIGEDISRVLEYVPGHFVEHAYHREKWACGSCKRGVTSAPAPLTIIHRSAADASLLAHVAVSKYVDHTPLHRLHRVYARSGATIPSPRCATGSLRWPSGSSQSWTALPSASSEGKAGSYGVIRGANQRQAIQARIAWFSATVHG